MESKSALYDVIYDVVYTLTVNGIVASMTPVEILTALTDAFEDALKKAREMQDKTDAGH